MIDILALIRKRVHPTLHHLVTADASFDDLRLNTIEQRSVSA